MANLVLTPFLYGPNGVVITDQSRPPITLVANVIYGGGGGGNVSVVKVNTTQDFDSAVAAAATAESPPFAIMLIGGTPAMIYRLWLSGAELLSGGQPEAPTVVREPSLTAALAYVGQDVLVDIGQYSGNPSPTVHWNLRHGSDDLTLLVSGGKIVAQVPGTLTLTVTVSNAAGTLETITKTLVINQVPAPAITTEASISPASGDASTSFLLIPAIADSLTPVTHDFSLTYGGVDVKAKVSNNRFQPDPGTSGELVYRDFISNAGGQVFSQTTAAVVPAGAAVRHVFVPGDKIIGSGHSLVDTSFNTGQWPGMFPLIMESIEDLPQGADHIFVKSTIPGSNTEVRWNATSALPTPTNARLDIGLYSDLYLAERGLDGDGVAPPYVEDKFLLHAEFLNDLNYEWLFTQNALLNGNDGAGARTHIYSIWPAIDGSMTPAGKTLRDVLVDYETRHAYRMDYLNQRLQEEYPARASDFKVYMIPNHRLFIRVIDDIAAGLVPGITALSQLFSDNIHPNNLGAYLVSALVATYTVGRKIDETTVYKHADVSTALAQYARDISWEIVSQYARTGLGGLDEGQVGMKVFPTETPDVTMGSSATKVVFDMSATMYQDTGTTPANVGDPVRRLLLPVGGTMSAIGVAARPIRREKFLELSGAQGFFGPISVSGNRYALLAATLHEKTGSIQTLLDMFINPTIAWNSSEVKIAWNAFSNRAISSYSGQGSDPAEVQIAFNTPFIFEAWWGNTEVSISALGRGKYSKATTAAVPATSQFSIGGIPDNGNWGEGPIMDVYAAVVASGYPTYDQRATMWKWAKSKIT